MELLEKVLIEQISNPIKTYGGPLPEGMKNALFYKLDGIIACARAFIPIMQATHLNDLELAFKQKIRES